jgi:pseudouridine synthase
MRPLLKPSPSSLRSLISITGSTATTLAQLRLRLGARRQPPAAAPARAQARGFDTGARPSSPAEVDAWVGASKRDADRDGPPARGAPRGAPRGGAPRGGAAAAPGPRGAPRSGAAAAPGPRAGALRLNKALAAVGAASRRGADDLVFAGRVTVNGAVVKEPGAQVVLGRDKLALDGRPLSTAAATSKYYFALNKPKGYICASGGGEGRGGGAAAAPGAGDKRVEALFDDWLSGWKRRHPGSGAPPRLHTVGRLDSASIGLVLVTNDGDWAQAAQHPSSGLTNEYSVTLDARPGRAELEAMAAGCEVGGARVVPQAVALDDSDRAKTARIRVVLAGGRPREVRAVVEAAGRAVRVLRRVRVGGFRLPRALGFGQFVELRPHEVRRVMNVGADRTV